MNIIVGYIRLSNHIRKRFIDTFDKIRYVTKLMIYLS